MANTIAHLLVAYKITELLPNIISNQEAYLLGSIAPDTIKSSENASREEYKRVHLRTGISDINWLDENCMKLFEQRVGEYIQNYLIGKKGEQFDFNLGYLVHLWTDELNHKSIRQLMLIKASKVGVSESDKKFFEIMVNDLEALDFILLDNNEITNSILKIVLDSKIQCSNDYIKKEYLQKSIIWIKRDYLMSIKTRTVQYLLASDINDFIDYSANIIITRIKEYVLAKADN